MEKKTKVPRPQSCVLQTEVPLPASSEWLDENYDTYRETAN